MMVLYLAHIQTQGRGTGCTLGQKQTSTWLKYGAGVGVAMETDDAKTPAPRPKLVERPRFEEQVHAVELVLTERLIGNLDHVAATLLASRMCNIIEQK